MRFLIAVAAGAMLSTPAYAQSFPGARIEANLGWDHLAGKVTYEDSAFPEDNFKLKDNTDGVLYGVTIGYDMKVAERIYLGIEGSADFTDNKKCSEVFGEDRACFKAKRNLAAGVRLGGGLSKSDLVYVGAAYVNGRATISYDDNLDPSNDFSYSDNRDGYRLSAGLEHRVSGNVFTKLEYRYSDYKDYKASAGTESASLGFDRHQVVAGIGARF
ncbi:outer membrane protein [Novosphingobium malaysiense]|uniref:Outer membrane protein beta-barrel domain-containing protein n=1 Tax=Novosphingobium malaysiense TaxID=1348853 RepID=A0A0B1ZEV5_9SPHN|nr:porin family protein [Novosphingobium malaysiense]KHK89025.1 hypothetical protein LK12_22670 [Novosphingobium malaysiense]